MPTIKVVTGLKGHTLNVPKNGRTGGAIVKRDVLSMFKPKPAIISPILSASGLQTQTQPQTNVEILREKIKQLNLNSQRGSAVHNKKNKYITF